MRTIETGKAIVDIVAWPENRPWEGRYQTSSQIERGLCRLVLSPDVFHDAARANTAYRRFARKIEREGLVPPNIVFRHMVSRTSQNFNDHGIRVQFRVLGRQVLRCGIRHRRAPPPVRRPRARSGRPKQSTGECYVICFNNCPKDLKAK